MGASSKSAGPVIDLSKRNKANARKGKTWERELREGLREAGFDVELPNRAGANKDKGDLAVRLLWGGHLLPDWERVVIEQKNEARLNLSGNVREALKEASEYATANKLPRNEVLGIAVIKRRGENWRKAYVVTTVEEFFGLSPEGTADSCAMTQALPVRLAS